MQRRGWVGGEGGVGQLALLLHVHVHQCTATAGQKRAFIAVGRTHSVSNSLPMSVLYQPSGWQEARWSRWSPWWRWSLRWRRPRTSPAQKGPLWKLKTFMSLELLVETARLMSFIHQRHRPCHNPHNHIKMVVNVKNYIMLSTSSRWIYPSKSSPSKCSQWQWDHNDKDNDNGIRWDHNDTMTTMGSDGMREHSGSNGGGTSSRDDCRWARH